MNLLENIQTFFSFQNQSLNVVIFGSILLGATSAIIGCFSFLQKRSLIGDSIAHSLLPGVCLGFLISGSKDTTTLLIGASISGLISVYFMDFVKSKTKLKNDTVLALTLTFFFGLGLMLLSYIQGSGNAAQSGIDHYLFGKAASMLMSDLKVYSLVSVIVLSFVLIFFKAFFLISFDPDFGEAIGLPVNLYRFILTTITVIAVALGIQTVGVVLMAAMLVTPASGAKFWTNQLSSMILIAAGFGIIGGLFGAFISFILPQMPTGPWIVISLSVLALLSLLFAPKKGIIYIMRTRKKWDEKLFKENVLKAFYHLGEKSKDFEKSFTLEDLIQKRYFNPRTLGKVLRRLTQEKKLIRVNNQWTLTRQGYKEGLRLTKIHRLWEMYLTSQLNIAPDHVHEDADSIEHIITPELEKQLEKVLDFPTSDPHDKNIPYE